MIILKIDRGEDAKELRQECSGSSEAGAGDVFAEGLNDSSCGNILFNCLKELEAKVVKIYEEANTTKERQIKGEKQLEDLTSSVDYIMKKLDEYKDGRKKKDEQIKCLRERVSFLENKNGKIEQQIDRQEQYSRRNCLLIHGIEERRHEVTDEVVIWTIKSEIDIDIDVKDIDGTHRIGAKSENKRRLIIFKFARHSERRKVFNSKKRLKDKNLSITESLTKLRVRELKAARDEYGFWNVWTVDGKILYKVDDTADSNPAVYYQ